MTKFADLHIHTHYSDSTLSPAEVVEEASQAGLSCISVTDHDTLAGIKPTQLAGLSVGLEVISGIELSSEIEGRDIHILGYFVDLDNETLRSELERMQQARRERVKVMVEKLKILGVDQIEPEEVFQLASSGSVGRPHLAQVLKNKGWVSSIAEAFEKYLKEGAPAYVGKFKITPQEAILLIQKAGGIPVFAHPAVTNKDELIPSLVEVGLKGLEVYYPNCSEVTIRYYEGLAKKYKLIATGGSDAHGKTKASTFIGKIRIPYEIVGTLKEQLNIAR